MSKLLSETTLKIDTDILRQATGVAEAEGISRSEYIRDLIISDLQTRRRKHLAMVSVFAGMDESVHQLSGVTGGHDE
jgi:metal-responsive CopG/Arc/MetJ family transcriptional regulator